MPARGRENGNYSRLIKEMAEAHAMIADVEPILWPARKPAAATPRSPPKPRTGAPASPRPSDVPNGSLRYNQENPKKKGSKSWHRYESYKKATTVDEYFRLQGTLGDLKYDFSRGFFKAPPALARWCASK